VSQDSAKPATVQIRYDPIRLTGRLETLDDATSAIWERLRSRALSITGAAMISDTVLDFPWHELLCIIREYGTKEAQTLLNFRFAPVGDAVQRIRQFLEELRRVRSARDRLKAILTIEQVSDALSQKGFTRRELREFQKRDLVQLLALPHGANFSVPGAGKTTVTLALHLLGRQPGQHLFVVGPKAAFPAWRGIVEECLPPTAPDNNAEAFTVVDGRPEQIDQSLRSGATRFLMSYDLMIRQQGILASYFARHPVHLVLDEAHRMKAGIASQRGAFLLSISNLPIRRDILTGTPMPQGPEDLASQMSFLWPGQGLDLQIQRGVSPRQALANLYVRTTKQELGLRKPHREFRQVRMAPGQMALYAVVRSEALRQIAVAVKGSGGVDYIAARRSVMRLLQLSCNPILALKAMSATTVGLDSGIVEEVLAEGPSSKMRAVADHVREMSREGKKAVIWTIFTDTILEMERMLADLNPVILYGAVPSGEPTDSASREGRLRRFHEDDACKVLIANPAAAGEGISLHKVCHHALYLDRSYVSTHYLQSIDRIHRLGLDPDVETYIYIYQSKAPPGIGSIDLSVSRRLGKKVRGLTQLLEDPDLHQIALDEEEADDPVDYDVDLQDLMDLVGELEGNASAETEEEA
jgi:hypothetical protein